MTLYNRGFSYYAAHSLSKTEALREGRKQIWISLHTKDRGLAEQRYFVVMSELMKRLRFKNETMTTPFQIPAELLISSLKETKAKLRQSGYGCVYPYDKHLIELLLVEHLQDKIRTEQNKAGLPMIADIYQNRFNEAHGYYYNGDFSLIDDECDAYFEQENLPRPTDSTRNVVREVFMRAQLQFLDYMIKCMNGEKPALPTQYCNLPPPERIKLTRIKRFSAARRSFRNCWALAGICVQSRRTTCRTPQTIWLISRIPTGMTITRKAFSSTSKSAKGIPKTALRKRRLTSMSGA